MNREEWRGVIDCPNYEVSNLGRVRNRTTGQVLSTALASGGYPSVQLYRNHRRKTLKTGLLVAESFIGPRPGLPGQERLFTLNHIDGDKLNNALSNLEWVTQRENMRHAFRIGLASNVGEKNSNAKLTADAVLAIRCSDESKEELGRRYGVDASAIREVRRGRTWAHLLPAGGQG